MQPKPQVFDELKAWCANNDFYQKPGSSAVKKHKTPEKILEEVTKLDAIFKKAEGLPLQVPRKKEVEKLKQKMQNEATAIQQIKGIAKTINPIEIEEAFVRAKEFELMDMPEVSALKSRLEKLTQQLPLVKAIQTALDEEDGSELGVSWTKSEELNPDFQCPVHQDVSSTDEKDFLREISSVGFISCHLPGPEF
ncbi:unnamed protein product [Effrenium voratum]|nr:unnamed protein product [Effrenium voratum]